MIAKLIRNIPPFAPIGIALFIIWPISYTLVKAQSTNENKMYKVWIFHDTQGVKYRGYLYDVMDSAVLVSPEIIRYDKIKENDNYKSFNYQHIEKIKIRKKGRIGRGIAYGALSGFTIGMIRGFIEGDDPPCTGGNYLFSCSEKSGGQKAVVYGISYAWLGGLAGAFIGSFKIKIPINGSKNTLTQERNRLKKYSYNQLQ